MQTYIHTYIKRKHCYLDLSTSLCENISKYFFLDLHSLLLFRNTGLSQLSISYEIRHSEIKEKKSTFHTLSAITRTKKKTSTSTTPFTSTASKESSTLARPLSSFVNELPSAPTSPRGQIPFGKTSRLLCRTRPNFRR